MAYAGRRFNVSSEQEFLMTSMNPVEADVATIAYGRSFRLSQAEDLLS